MRERAPVIRRPDLQSRRRRAVLGLLGLLGWALWIYLWLPVATVGGWVFGGWLFRREMVEPGDGYIVTILSYFLVIVALAVVFLGWALYNRARFSGLDRRKPRPPAGDAEMAAALGASESALNTLRAARRVVLHISPGGEIAAVEVSSPPSPEPVVPGAVPAPIERGISPL